MSGRSGLVCSPTGPEVSGSVGGDSKRRRKCQRKCSREEKCKQQWQVVKAIQAAASLNALRKTHFPVNVMIKLFPIVVIFTSQYIHLVELLQGITIN